MKINKSILFISVISVLALFLRSYRQSYLLGFYYDQGRDASIVKDILTLKNIPAIGPTTGIEGLHLGPFWYYLLAPIYLISLGDPATAAIIVSLIETLTIPLVYFTIRRYFVTTPATLFSIFWSFSYYIIRSSRWFSNPTPIPFFVALIFFYLCQIIVDKKYKLIPVITFLLGLTLQLEAASAIFFIPSLIIIFLINIDASKEIFTKKNIISSFLSFFITLIPQLAYEVKNNFPISKTFVLFVSGQKNSVSGQSWAIPSPSFIGQRFNEYYKILFTKLDTNLTISSIVFLLIFILSTINLIRHHRQNKLIQISLVWLFAPLFCLLFFVGNFGRLYDYYLTGFFVPFFIVFSCFPLISSKKYIKHLLLVLVFVLFYFGNVTFTRNYLTAGVDGPSHISLGNQKQSINYICNQTRNIKYNLDIYVPPVIPYGYYYLLEQLYENNTCQPPSDQKEGTIFILYEVDLDNPTNLENWLNNYKDYQVADQKKFGGITVNKITSSF